MSFFRTLGTPAQAMPDEERRTLDLAGRAIPLVIRKNGRARRLTLRIEPGGTGLRLTIPGRTRRRDVDAFLDKHRGWAAERLNGLPAPTLIGVGSRLPVGGVDHEVVHSGRLRGTTRREEREDGPVIVVSGPEDRAAARVEAWLKAEARREIDAAIQRHAPAVGREPGVVRVKDTRTRWGSCSSAGALSFSWRLAMAPANVLEYLVAHEMAHLVHMNHGPDFWALTRELCPWTNEAKAWLRHEGQALHAFEFGPARSAD